ncbi:MAG: RNA polymerase sigma factor [Pseudomarimonas sp.]
MAAESSDEDLMLAYAAGSAAAFDVLYGRHRGPLFRFLLRGLSQRALAEECFQEVWSRVIVARERYRPEAAFTTWLYQIAHRLLIDQYRRTSSRPVAVADSDAVFEYTADDDSQQPDRVLSDFEIRRRLQLALAELPDEQRIAVQLRLEQELSLETIGEITGVGRETVKSRLRYALDRLKARMAP